MRISLITEGDIDRALVPCVLKAIAERRGITWPLQVSDYQEAHIRKRGYGAVLEAVRNVIKEMEAGRYTKPDILVIVLDSRKTADTVREIRRLVRAIDWVVIGIAVEEIEAWWLADRNQVLAWLDISTDDASNAGYPDTHAPEKDQEPKNTLHKLTEISEKVLFNYGRGSVQLAEDFADSAWQNFVDIESMKFKCPRGFTPFFEKITNLFH